jgi:hypothetical protein
MADSDFDGISSLVKLSGVSVPARARFIGEALVSSTFSSLTLGLSFGMVGAICSPIGPLIPFLVGSWTGYTFGLVNHWRTGSNTVRQYAQQYPTILAHALATEGRGIAVPPKVVQASEERLGKKDDEESDHPLPTGSVTLEEWIRQGGLGRWTWSILAAQSCRQDVEELQRQHRERLVQEHYEKYG